MCYQKVIQFPQKKFNGPIPVAAMFSNFFTFIQVQFDRNALQCLFLLFVAICSSWVKFIYHVAFSVTLQSCQIAEKEMLAMARVWLGEKQEFAACKQGQPQMPQNTQCESLRDLETNIRI